HDVPLATTFGVLVVFIVAFYILCWYLIQRGRGLRS
ncbi:ABC transporter permease, partial [Klebsiella aerogenes]|nr:ABC transporter permease [Klebsiella aerogenes]